MSDKSRMSDKKAGAAADRQARERRARELRETIEQVIAGADPPGPRSPREVTDEAADAERRRHASGERPHRPRRQPDE